MKVALQAIVCLDDRGPTVFTYPADDLDEAGLKLTALLMKLEEISEHLEDFHLDEELDDEDASEAP